MSTEPMFFARPEGTPIELRIPSRLASWNVAGHADQLRLTASLDGADELLTPTLNQLTGSVSHSRRPVRKILDGHWPPAWRARLHRTRTLAEREKKL